MKTEIFIADIAMDLAITRGRTTILLILIRCQKTILWG